MSEALHATIQEAIEASTGELALRWPDLEFDTLAEAVFAHQFAGCAPYAAYCAGRGVTPARLRLQEPGTRHRAIPAVPTDVFKTVALATFPPEEAAATFLTSGTTVGTRGRHLLRTLGTYQASLGPWLRRWLVPGEAPLVLALIAPFSEDPASSLGFMVSWAVAEVGAPGSTHCWRGGPDLDAFAAAARAADRPVLVLATARALQHLLEERLADGPIPLPPGSRVMETGGFKGAARTLAPQTFADGLCRGLDLPPHALVSEYGMTELASQGYGPGYRAAVDPATGVLGLRDDLLVFPPWCRAGAVDPDTLELLPPGVPGLLRFWDLANVDSVLAVQTSDVGIVTADGVLLRGRAPGASPRGCSIAVDELLRGLAS